MAKCFKIKSLSNLFKIKNLKLKILQSESGQSLIEVLIGLAIGAILIGAASLGVVFILRSSTATQHLQSGTQFNKDLVDRVRSVAGATWQDLHGLTKGTSTAYFVVASGTQQIVIEGKEGVLSNEIFSGLVGHWNFDEATSTATTTTFDTSGQGNHGTLVNGVSRATTTCKVSHCLEFDGVDDAVGLVDVLDIGSSSFTIGMWVFKDPQSRAILVGNCCTGSNLVNFEIGGGSCTSSGLRLWWNGGQVDICSFSEAIQDSTWTHVALVRDKSAGEVHFFVNGQINRTHILSLQDITFSVLHRIGSDYRTGSTVLDGRIDDVRIYNRALSADEVQRLWNSTAFTRYFNIENVSRDSNGDIVTSGGNNDPSTQKITVYIEWPTTSGDTGQVSVVDYVTRWANRVFNQSDWSGGSGQTGVITEPNNRFDNATSISNPAGSIRIEGL
jgi:prepilin-type N-terminal cleavage/methylation domain-containing protein